MTIVCEICGRVIERVDGTVLQGIEGYVKARRAGGSNAVRLMKFTDKFVHVTCAQLKKDGHLNQPGFFDDFLEPKP